MIVGTQFFPSAILILPLFRMWANLGMFNTYTSLIATYTAASLSLCTWLLVGFYQAIPDEVLDAATIDGCGKFGLAPPDRHAAGAAGYCWRAARSCLSASGRNFCSP